MLRGIIPIAGAALLIGAATAEHAYSQTQVPAKPPAAEAASGAAAATESQQQAQTILMRMAEFLAGTSRFSVTMDTNYDAVQESGQKIEFGHIRKVTLDRPTRMRIEDERSDGAKTLTVFSGKEITLIDTESNVYATAPQTGGTDETIVHFVRDLHMRLPLAVLLTSKLPKELKNRVKSIDYVEKTSIGGAPSDHLAARTDTVDFQVWVAQGDKPLLQRVVLTYKNAPGQPEFRAQFSDWNLAPAIADATFTVKPPDGALKIAFANELPHVAANEGKPSIEKEQ